jgi:uncharacterized membrane protein YphA (DoxX/SURF4 family)
VTAPPVVQAVTPVGTVAALVGSVPIAARHLPGRLATGAFILHSGWEKWHGSEQQAEGVHGLAAGSFPVLRQVPPTQFLRLLAVTEMAVGSLLLWPFAPNAISGALLSGFSGALLAVYWRSPLRKPGSIWPTQAGTAISKDVWMLGIGLGLLTDAL